MYALHAASRISDPAAHVNPFYLPKTVAILPS